MQAACEAFSAAMGMDTMITAAALACGRGAGDGGGHADPCASAPCLNGGACSGSAGFGTGHRLLQGEEGKVQSTGLT